jgi:hypothetical protein
MDWRRKKNKKRIIFFVLCSLNRIFAIKKMAKILSLDKKKNKFFCFVLA